MSLLGSESTTWYPQIQNITDARKMEKLDLTANLLALHRELAGLKHAQEHDQKEMMELREYVSRSEGLRCDCVRSFL